MYFCLLILDSHENCETCLDVLQALENIDDDADRQNIALFKTTDAKFAEDIGISEFPSLGKGLFKNFVDKMRWVSSRYHSRFFVLVGHETTYANIGNRHFFTETCHRQTYQNF